MLEKLVKGGSLFYAVCNGAMGMKLKIKKKKAE